MLPCLISSQDLKDFPLSFKKDFSAKSGVGGSAAVVVVDATVAVSVVDATVGIVVSAVVSVVVVNGVTVVAVIVVVLQSLFWLLFSSTSLSSLNLFLS